VAIGVPKIRVLPALALLVGGCVFDPSAGHRPDDGGAVVDEAGTADLGVITDADPELDADPIRDADSPELPILDGAPDAEPDAGFDAPIVDPIRIAIPANTSTVVTLRGRDPAGRPLTYAIDTQGLDGRAQLNGASVDYDTPNDYRGVDRFRYRASNGVLQSPWAEIEVQVWDNRTCSQILSTASGTVADGIYSLDPDGSGGDPPFDAWCEMDLGGGGWMLVARSVAGGSAAQFGWRAPTGSLADWSQPYALGALGRGIEFNRLLATSYTGTDTIGEAYSLGFDEDFEDDCDDEGCRRDNWYPYAGGCALSLSLTPSMLLYAGHNDVTDHFFFRDSSGPYETGLEPDGWNTFYSSCGLGGGLDGQQGMLFLRCNTADCVPRPW
jgi:hypothetical protein